jgi:DNA-binding response OmpR family regulator
MDVLVLEDAQELRQVWCDFLEDEGHAVTAVDNAESAMAAMHEQPYDLLMLDLHLERGTSIGVSHYARTALPDCRIIMITGERVFAHGNHMAEMPGVDWLLRKPVSLPDLAALIDYAAMSHSRKAERA